MTVVTTVKSDSAIPKIFSGKVDITIPASTSDETDIDLSLQDPLQFIIYVSIDSDEYLFQLPIFQVGSNPPIWEARTAKSSILAYYLTPGSEHPVTLAIVDSYIISVLINNISTKQHTYHINYFLYGQKANT